MEKSSKTFIAACTASERTGNAIMLAVRGDPTARNEAATRASALLLVTKGFRVATSPSDVNKLMPEGQWFRSQRELRMATGGGREVLRRVAAGGVIPLSSLGCWTPDFWSGLVSSGAIHRMNRPRQWIMVSPKAHAALADALTAPRVPFEIPWSRKPYGLVLFGLWPAEMGADDPEGVGVLAGLLAGGRRIERNGESWLGITWRERNAALLERHLIPYIKIMAGQDTLLVSPFWGRLLADSMPPEIGEWFRLWKGRKAMCPLLPWAFLAYAWGVWPGKRGSSASRGMVPWTVSRQAMNSNHGIKVGRRGLRRLAFEKLGMRGVSPGVRAAWLKGLAARGVKAEDFPVGKVPLDFDEHMCHSVGKEKEGQP